MLSVLLLQQWCEPGVWGEVPFLLVVSPMLGEVWLLERWFVVLFFGSAL